MIIKWVRLICIKCNRFIFDLSISELYPDFNIEAIRENSKDFVTSIINYFTAKMKSLKVRYCHHCNNIAQQIKETGNIIRSKFEINHVQPDFKRSSFSDHIIEIHYLNSVGSENKKKYKKNKNHSNIKDNLYTTDILHIFESLKDSEVTQLGLDINAHPRNYINRYMLVPPVNTRFINNIKKSMEGNNYITSNIEMIIKYNDKIEENLNKYSPGFLGPGEDIKSGSITNVLGLINSYNKYIGIVDSANEPNSLYSLMKGKEGLIRGLLVGKIVGKICRFVIACDTSLEIDEITLPRKYAMSMFVKETVTPFNKHILQKYVSNGPNYPGCTKVYSKQFQTFKNNNGEYIIEYGDVVHRHLLTNDIIIMNRSPTLSLTSIAAVKIIVWNGPIDIEYVSINVLGCSFYNADFDGDMMSGKIIADESTREEVRQTLHPSKFIVQYTDSSIIIGQTQDTALAFALITYHDTIISRSEAMTIFNSLPISYSFDKKEYTGREIMSIVMPNINYEMNSPMFKDKSIELFGDFDESDKKIVIKNGQILSGIVCGNAVKAKKGSIYHEIYYMLGAKMVMHIIFIHQQVLKRFADLRGFSISYADLRLSSKTKKLIDLVQSQVMREVSEFHNMLIEGNVKAPEGMSIQDYVESQIIKMLNPGSKYLYAILTSLNPKENWIMQMVLSGSKGSLSNVYNVFAAVGQLKINNKRLKQKLDYIRSNIWSPQFDLSPTCRGYIPNSYMDGWSLSDTQNIGEELTRNVLTKNVVTSEGGSFSRVIISSIETAIVDNRLFTVRGIGNNIIQFSAGGDCFAGNNIFENKLELFLMSDDEIKKVYGSRANILIQDRNELHHIKSGIYSVNGFYVPDEKFLLPLNFRQSIRKNPKDNKPVNENQDEKLQMLDTYCENIHYLRFNSVHRKKKTNFPKILTIVFTLCKIGIRSKLTPDIVNCYTMEEFSLLLEHFSWKIMSSFYDYGDPIGIRLGQSLSSPITQYLIDAHHVSASGGTSKDNLNYAKSILNKKASADMKNKFMYIYLKPKYENSKVNATHLANYITSKKLEYVVSKSEIIMDVKEFQQYPKDKDLVSSYLTKTKTELNINNFYLVRFRYTLKKKLMKMYRILSEDIINKLEFVFNDDIVCITGDDPDNSENVLLILFFRNSFNWKYISNTETKKTTTGGNNDIWKDILAFDKQLIKKFTVNDFPGITNSSVKSNFKYEIVNGTVIKKEYYYVFTIGINMKNILLIDKVDKHRTICNIPQENYKYEGIIGAKSCIINELYNTFDDALNFSPNQYELISDIMTETGEISAISETGQRQREPNDVLLRSNLKDPAKAFYEGALNGVENQMTSTKSHVILGQTIKYIGTTLNTIVMDEMVEEEDIEDNIEDLM